MGASPAQIGVLLTLSGAAGVLTSSVCGTLSDELRSRKPLIAASCLSGAAGYVVFALTRSYVMALVVSITLLSGVWTAFPQLYARGRELLDAAGAAPAFALSTLRSVVSLTWVFGPPLAGLLLAVSGFSQLFLVVVGLLAGAALLAVADGTAAVADADRPPPRWGSLLSRTARSPFPGLDAGAALAAGSVALLQTANSMSITTMPLFVTQNLHGSTGDVGLLLGGSAALEIPVMIAMGWAAGRIGYFPVLLGSWVLGPIYYGAVALATSTWHVALAQVVCAIYMSGLFGVAIAYFQDLMGEPGSASTLYFNAITAGSTIAGVAWGGAVASAGYRGAYVTCLGLAVTSTVMLVAGHLVRRRRVRPASSRSRSNATSGPARPPGP